MLVDGVNDNLHPGAEGGELAKLGFGHPKHRNTAVAQNAVGMFLAVVIIAVMCGNGCLPVVIVGVVTDKELVNFQFHISVVLRGYQKGAFAPIGFR